MSEYYAVIRSGSSDTLEHFGVLGMRCGIRRDKRVKAAKATYRTNRKAIKKDSSLSKAQKKKKIAASREEWMQERENAANRLYSKNSKAANKAIARMSTKKTVAQAGLLGSYGALKYNQMRRSGGGRFTSAVAGSKANVVNHWLMNAPATMEYVRNRRARKKR